MVRNRRTNVGTMRPWTIALEKKRNRNLVRKIKYRKLLEKEGWVTPSSGKPIAKEPPEDHAGPSNKRRADPQPSMVPNERDKDGCNDNPEWDPSQTTKTNTHPRKRKHGAGTNTMQKLYEKAKEEKNARREQREEQMQRKQETLRQKEEAAARRKKRSADMRKVNRKGQPLMKSRMEGVLEKLAKET